MIRFIICEDEKALATKYKNEIDKFMMNYDDDYECGIFDGYGQEWYEYSRSNPHDFKIYLLDVKTNQGSGLDAARIVREELDDWTAMLIMITSFNEYRYDALNKRLMLIDYINKLDKCDFYLREALNIALKNYENRPKVLRYTYRGEIHNIEFKNIVYIEKELAEKKCTIYTTHNTKEEYPGTITNLIKILGDNFMQVSRNTIINLEHLKSYRSKENKLIFVNGYSTTCVSRDKRKGIINYVRGIR